MDSLPRARRVKTHSRGAQLFLSVVPVAVEDLKAPLRGWDNIKSFDAYFLAALEHPHGIFGDFLGDERLVALDELFVQLLAVADSLLMKVRCNDPWS